MKTVLAQHGETAYALLRIVVGFSFLCHGVVAVWFLFGEGTPYSPAWLYNTAGIVEFVAGALVMVGYRARLAAFLASGQMAVAYFYRHQPDGWLPIQNDGELAALYCFLFLFISAAGPGKWSIESCCPPAGRD